MENNTHREKKTYTEDETKQGGNKEDEEVKEIDGRHKILAMKEDI